MKSGLHGIRHHLNTQEGGSPFPAKFTTELETVELDTTQGNSEARLAMAKNIRTASPLLCRCSSKLPEHETSPFHLRGANHGLPKTNQPLTFPVF